MKYIVTFIWALMLTQMVNFILNSLQGGGTFYFELGIILAVLITLTMYILDLMLQNPDEAK